MIFQCSHNSGWHYFFAFQTTIPRLSVMTSDLARTTSIHFYRKPEPDWRRNDFEKYFFCFVQTCARIVWTKDLSIENEEKNDSQVSNLNHENTIKGPSLLFNPENSFGSKDLRCYIRHWKKDFIIELSLQNCPLFLFCFLQPVKRLCSSK